MRSWARARLIPIIALLGVAAAHAETGHSDSLQADYQSLLEWMFSSAPSALPSDGVAWKLDTAAWELDQGQVWYQRPTSGGRITGLVFQGSGRFHMSVPDPVELRQLRRFAADAELETLDEEFDALVVRVVGLPWIEDLPAVTGSDYTNHPLARDRHNHWLVFSGHDADSRVVAGLSRPEDIYLRVDMRTLERGWMTYEFDLLRGEEISLEWFNSKFSVTESWLSLDQAEDRTESGRPSNKQRPRIDIEFVELRADLTQYARESPRGMARVRPMKARFSTEVRYRCLTTGDQAIQFLLASRAKVERVTNEDGEDLPFLRYHLGKQSSSIDKKIYDPSLVVLLSEPSSVGSTRRLVFEYELEADGYMPGRSWYPQAEYPGTGLLDRHQGRLVLTSRQEFSVRAMGVQTGEDIHDNLRTTTFSLARPVKMMSFVFAKRPFEEILQFDGLPDVHAFGSLGGYLNEERIHQVGADVVDSLDFYQNLFDSTIPDDRLQTALIPSGHGQAFDGLLHIGDFSVGYNSVKFVDLFRAHEANRSKPRAQKTSGTIPPARFCSNL